MSLLTQAMEDCVTLINTTTPDGFGGTTNQWQEGLQFKGAFDFQTSIEAKIAEKQGVTGLWNILIPKDVELEYHNVFKRVSNGQIYRVTSKDDKTSPKGAGMNLKLVSAEEWELV